MRAILSVVRKTGFLDVLKALKSQKETNNLGMPTVIYPCCIEFEDEHIKALNDYL